MIEKNKKNYPKTKSTVVNKPKSISTLDEQKELKKLLEENLKLSRELHEMMTRVNRWVAWRRIWIVVKILIIAIPIVLGAIYLPPLIQKAIEPYQQFLNFSQDDNNQNLIQQIKEQINQ